MLIPVPLYTQAATPRIFIIAGRHLRQSRLSPRKCVSRRPFGRGTSQ